MGERTEDVSWRVGDLAALTGLTVRTLHHDDDVGLLRPDRTAAGHRVYRRAHVERLSRISVLRRSGASLDDIAAALDEPGWTLDGALRAHLAALEDQVLRTSRRRTGTSWTCSGRNPDRCTATTTGPSGTARSGPRTAS